MTRVYDNWDRLVRATLRREQLRLCGQRTPSDLSSVPSSTSFNFGEVFEYNQILRATYYFGDSNLIRVCCGVDPNRDTATQDLPTHAVSRGELNPIHTKDETSSKQVKFKDLVSTEMEDSDLEGQQNDREPSVNWTSKSTGYTTALEDPITSYSPYLPPVLEEPSSLFSKARDEDPLPAIEGLQISGEAVLGRELQACGYSINGTTSCNFKWVRHMEDGSFNYIDGAKQPNYLVPADDIDTYLAIEVQQFDNRKRTVLIY